MKLIELMEQRRTIYGIGKEEKQSRDVVTKAIKEAIKHSPSAFNSQSVQAILLYGAKSDQLWDIVMDALKKAVPAENFGPTEEKINGFKGGFGTVLFFEDRGVIQGLEEGFPMYAPNFMPWGEQASGIAQFAVWTALTELGIGASLQHYTELIEAEVKKKWNVPSNWRLVAQMPFGSIESPAGEKEYYDIDQRVRVDQ